MLQSLKKHPKPDEAFLHFHHSRSRETKIGGVKRQNQSGFNTPTECEDHFIPHISILLL